MSDFKQMEQEVAANTGVDPDEYSGRVVVLARWRGLLHRVEKIAEPAAATHYRMDRMTSEASVEVRRLLSAQLTGHAVSTAPVPDPLPRLWDTLMSELYRYLAQTRTRLVLSPPGIGLARTRWRADTRPDEFEAPAYDSNPPVGVGSTMRVAIENLVRAFEGREPIDG